MTKFEQRIDRIESVIVTLRKLAREAPELMERVSMVYPDQSPSAHWWGSHIQPDQMRGIIGREAADWGWRRQSDGGYGHWNWTCDRYGITLLVERIEPRVTDPVNGGLVVFEAEAQEVSA